MTAAGTPSAAGAEPHMPLLSIQDLEVTFTTDSGRSVAVSGVSFDVRAGETVAIVGESGSGKSTTAAAVIGLLAQNGSVTGGRILFDGEDVAASTPHGLVRRGLFHVMEGRRIFEDLTVEENLTAATFALSGRGLKPTPFDLVYSYFPRLHERRKGLAGYLSGGEQQMLAIGRALVAQPKLMLLDEPSLGLSPAIVEDMFDAIRRINGDGMTVLLVEQNVAMALEVSTRAYVLEEGRIVAEGEPRELSARPEIRRAYLGL